MKKLLRQSQRDHEREAADYGVMMRELQTNLSTERNKSETMEHQVNYLFHLKQTTYVSLFEISLKNVVQKS
ncbi:unnamed protein product [Rotaria socialis]|uniref:Uncharacterized protein n=1 Tax=Rotaria socialis TaxID=392032 RepID=A0A822CI75_9BILA|nr:unnamed protein product [Rotaria socialis]